MTAATEFHRLAEWKRVLLRRRGLERPDGRALYLYRLSEAEFTDLEQLLRRWLSMLLPRFGMAQLAGLSGFAALFVLYAAEWWRRRYDGSGFSWEPILRDLSADPDEWTPSQRSDSVKSGLQAWYLKPREHGGLRFLGSVAVQGGLPLRLLASARGGIGQLLGRVLQLAAGTQVTQQDLQAWVESLGLMLPKSYRQATIYTLLADVAWTVLRLKQEANLVSSKEAISVLDAKVPGWRERFPLPVDDQHAQGLIEQLIRDAASVRIERRAVLLPVERFLERDSHDGWTLRSRLVLSDSIPSDRLAELFRTQVDELPRTADLALVVNDQTQQTSLRRLAGSNAYRIERKPWGVTGDGVFAEHILRMSAPDGRVWSITASKGESLDDELPWVFVEADSSYLLVRQGSGGVSATDALIALAPDWEVDAQTNTDLQELGQLAIAKRRIFHVRGVVRASRADGLACRVRTGHAGAEESHFSWEGHRYWLDFVSPTIAFRGMPSLYRIGEDGNKRRVEGQFGYNVVGGAGVSQPVGPTVLRYPANGEVKERCRVLLLPERAALNLAPLNALSGRLILSGWQATTAEVHAPNVNCQAKTAGGDVVLELEVAPGKSVPDMVDLEVYWAHTTAVAKMRVPFPARGVRAFDRSGQEIQDAGLVAVQHLAGTRLLISIGQQTSRIMLEISASRSQVVRRHRLRLGSDAVNLEIRLQDYSSDIQHLLSIDDTPDAQVTVIVRIDNDALFSLNLARYSVLIEREGDNIQLDMESAKYLSSEVLLELPVWAVRLERPGDEAVSLAPCLSEGVPTGAWNFSTVNRESGSWLVYPGPESALPFRPTLWTVPGSFGECNKLAAAIGTAQQSERDYALDEVISELAQNFDDPIWVDIEQLASQIGHLPLATLDVWRRFTHSPYGMAALALRFWNPPYGIVERFAEELPFAWETVPLGAWQGAMASVKAQCVGSFGQEGGLTVFRTHLDSRIKHLVSINGALAFLLGVAGAEYLTEMRREAELLKYLGNQAKAILFEGEQSRLMDLLRHHADDQWPTGFNRILSSVDLDEPLAHYLNTNMQSFQLGVVNMPLLLAVQTVMNRVDNWFADNSIVHIMRSYRAFDPDWFDEAFNQTVARCVADGVLEG